MYAVIRTGGKQYRVAPGDVIKVEKFAPADDGSVEFSDILAVANEGSISNPAGARVVGQVVEEGRNDKILVFHYKKKKQYKKLNGHRQAFASVRITQISADGQTFDAPALPEKKVKAPKKTVESDETGEASAAPKKKAAGKKPAAKKSAAKKPAAKKAPAKKSAAKKSSKKK